MKKQTAVFIAILATIFFASSINLSSAHSRHHTYWQAPWQEFLSAPSLFQPPTYQQAQNWWQPSALPRAPVERHGRGRAEIASHNYVANLVREHAEAIGFPVAYALGLARMESGFKMLGCRGRHGACGPLQVLRSTARRMGCSSPVGIAGLDCGLRYAKYVFAVKGRYGACVALSSYNAGEGVTRCSRYGRTILALARGARTFREAGWYAEYTPHHHRHHRWI